jgi:hypothetical protein
MALTVDSSGGQYAMWDLHSAVGNGVSCPGVVTGGRFNPRYKTHRARGIAFQQSLRPSANVFAPKLKVQATKDTKPLIQNAVRSGSLPWLKLQGGGVQQGWLHDNAKIHMLKWSFSSMDALLECEFDFYSLLVTKTSGAIVQTALGGNVFTALDCVASVGATDFGVIALEGEIMNNLHTGPTAGSRTSGHLRDPQWIVEGPEEHKLKITTLMPYADTPIADYPTEAIGVVASFTDDAGTPNTLTFTYSNLAHDEEFQEQEFKEDGEVHFVNQLIGKPGCLVIS